MPSFFPHRFRPVLRAFTLLAVLLPLLPAAPASAGEQRPEPRERGPLFGIVDSYRKPSDAQQAGSTWDRVLFLWQQIQPDDEEEFERKFVSRDQIRGSLKRGIEMTAVLQGTPEWAALNRPDGAGAVPRNLDRSPDSAKNYWARFVEQMVEHYRGDIRAWIIWNEPDFRPEDPGDWWTWAGTAEDYYQLLKHAYRVIKDEDPDAKVVFAATAFWPDSTAGRELFLERVLKVADQDPEARKHGYFFDAVGLNLYCSDRAIYSVHQQYTRVLAAHGLSKPLWLTETNCAPYDDPHRPMPPEARVTQEEQASYLVRAFAMARAVGYERIAWYSMIDRPTLADPWGLLRENGERRPAFYAYQLVSQLLGPERNVYLAHMAETSQHTSPAPVVRVVAEASDSRVQVLWNTSTRLVDVRFPARGTRARLLDPIGAEAPLKRVDGWWVLSLGPGRAPRPSDPPGYQLDGRPLLLVEEGLKPGAPLPPLRFGPLPDKSRWFPESGYSIEDDRFWAAYERFGGRDSLGLPVSFEFQFQGSLIQLFEYGALRLDADGQVRVMPLAATTFRAVEHLATVPLPVPPRPIPAMSDAEARARIDREVPTALREVYEGWVRCPTQDACDRRALAIERFGLPLGPAVHDPARPQRVYQRFESGVLWAEGARGGQIPLGSLLRNVLLGQPVAATVRAELSGAGLYRQYAPARPRGLAHPDSLPRTDLLPAF